MPEKAISFPGIFFGGDVDRKMRIKFEKGMTPEAIGRAFVDYIRENSIIIGAVNMYVQTYGPDGKAEKYSRDDDILMCSPSPATKKRYIEEVAEIRRRRMKAV